MERRLDNLKTIRKEKNLTRRELSLLSGVAPQTIQKLEDGLVNVDDVKLSTLIKLAKALHCKVVNLLPKDLQKVIK